MSSAGRQRSGMMIPLGLTVLVLVVSPGLFMGCGEEDSSPSLESLSPNQMIIVRSDGSKLQVYRISEIQRALAFPIVLPAYLPEGSKVDSLQVDERAGLLLIGLANPSLPTGFMILEEHPGRVQITEELPDREVNGTPAQFVPRADNTGVQALAWSPCGRGFVIRAALSEDELIRIAESIPIECS